MKRISLILSLVGLSACGMIERHPSSGYATAAGVQDRPQDFYADRAAYERDIASQELGLSPSRPLGDLEQQQLQDRLRLKRLEQSLRSNREREQYYSVKPNLGSDRERIELLELPTMEARQRYAIQRGALTASGRRPAMVKAAIEANDITVGMSKNAVMESWGDPDLVEVAGNPLYGNERWSYKRTVTGNNGYTEETRTVFFESGRVVGWQRD